MPAGGKRPGAGRKPRSATPARYLITIRLTEAEHEYIKQQAEKNSQTMPEYIRQQATKKYL